MKRMLKIIVYGLAALTLFSCNINLGTGYHDPVTMKEAIKITKSIWSKGDVANMCDYIMSSGTVVAKCQDGTELAVPSDSWVVFIIMDYGVNTMFNSTVLFVDIHTAEVTQVDNVRVTSDYYLDHKYVLKTYKQTRSDETAVKRVYTKVPANTDAGKWAVILSGGGNPCQNYFRYWNDCSLIYQTLKYNYGFDEDNIFVLMSDGGDPSPDQLTLSADSFVSSSVDLDGEGDNDVDFPATYTSLATVFSILAANVENEDEVFFFVTDHGLSQDGDSHIVLWNNETIADWQFAQLVELIPSGARLHFLFGQCYSGGFIDNLAGSNRSIATACRSDELSYSTNLIYDDFLYHWTNAALQNYAPGSREYANTNADDQASFGELFIYARDHDEAALQGSEHPQYYSNPTDFGEHYGLNNLYLYFPNLTGPSNVSIDVNGIFSVSGLPSNAVLTWSTSDNVIGSAVSNTSFSAYGYDYEDAYAGNGAVTFRTTIEGVSYSMMHVFGLWKSGHNVTDHLITGGIYGTEGSFRLNIPNFEGANINWFCDSDTWILYPDTDAGVIMEGVESEAPGSVWVTFNNPLGEFTRIVYEIQ